MNAKEKFERDTPDYLGERGYCSKEHLACGQCGYDGKFLRKVVQAAVLTAKHHADMYDGDNMYPVEPRDIWQEIEQRMAEGEGK